AELNRFLKRATIAPHSQYPANSTLAPQGSCERPSYQPDADNSKNRWRVPIHRLKGFLHMCDLLTGVGAQLLEEGHFLLEVIQCLANLGIITMPQHVNVEIIFPLPSTGRTGFEACHGNPVVRQGRQHGVDSASPVRNRQNDAGLVVARRQGFYLSNRQEAGAILWIILNA